MSQNRKLLDSHGLPIDKDSVKESIDFSTPSVNKSNSMMSINPKIKNRLQNISRRKDSSISYFLPAPRRQNKNPKNRYLLINENEILNKSSPYPPKEIYVILLNNI
jgi:hypothetical protein